MSENTQMMQELNVSPKKVRARKGYFQVTINNKENLTNTYQLKASDSEEMCTYNFDTHAVTVEAGATAKVALTVSFKKPLFTGAPKVCNFTVTAITSTMEVKTTEGQLEGPSLLPVWALAACGLAVVAIIAIVIVAANSGDGSAKSPANTSVATTQTTSVTTKPASTSATPTLTSPSTSAAPTVTTTATTTTPTTTTPATLSTSTTPIPSGPVTIDFDKLIVPESGSTAPPKEQFKSLGVLFFLAQKDYFAVVRNLLYGNGAHSQPYAVSFGNTGLEAHFVNPATGVDAVTDFVSAWVGDKSNEPDAITMTAYDINDHVITSSAYTSQPQSRLDDATDFGLVEIRKEGIHRIVFTVDNPSGADMDDFTFNPPTTTQVVDTPPNLNGVWAFVIKVTEANGVCAGEVGNSSSRQITITQSGRNVTLSGFLGNPANQLTGDITLDAGLWIVKVSGSYPEDGGVTTTSHRLVVKNTSDISGDEDWEWSGPGGTCPGGKASVTATRISSP